MFVKLCRWFFQQLVLVFDFYHRLGLKNREVTQLLIRSRSVLCRMLCPCKSLDSVRPPCGICNDWTFLSASGAAAQPDAGLRQPAVCTEDLRLRVLQD